MNKLKKSSKNSFLNGSLLASNKEESKVASKGGRLNIAHVERMIRTLYQRAEDDREILQNCIDVLDDFVDTLYALEMSLEHETSKEELQDIYDSIMEAVEELNTYGCDPEYTTCLSQQAYEDPLLEESLLLN